MTDSLAKQLLGSASSLLPLFEDEAVTDILINGMLSLYVERNGLLERCVSPFASASSLLDFIERLVIPTGRRIDACQPYIDGKLVDGSRFHIILPPIAPSGPLISIRRFRGSTARVALSRFAGPDLAAWLKAQVHQRKNILISGATGAGKTTLMGCLLDEVGPEERIAILEESAEIRVSHPHAVFLEARPATPDGIGEVTLRQLIRNTLRMRPDRIVLGECRGGEAFDMLQAMNTGHRGSLSTLHANGALDALQRLETLAMLSGLPIGRATLKEWIGSAIDIVVHVQKSPAGRRVAEVLLIEGVEGEVYRFLPWFPHKYLKSLA